LALVVSVVTVEGVWTFFGFCRCASVCTVQIQILQDTQKATKWRLNARISYPIFHRHEGLMQVGKHQNRASKTPGPRVGNTRTAGRKHRRKQGSLDENEATSLKVYLPQTVWLALYRGLPTTAATYNQ
jgi:hypothetical protein